MKNGHCGNCLNLAEDNVVLERAARDLNRHNNDLLEDLRCVIQWIEDCDDQDGHDLISGPMRAKYFSSTAGAVKLLKSDCVAAVTADEKPDGQEENKLV